MRASRCGPGPTRLARCGSHWCNLCHLPPGSSLGNAQIVQHLQIHPKPRAGIERATSGVSVARNLKGNRIGQWNIHVDDQFRIFFRWTGTDVENVEIVDYH